MPHFTTFIVILLMVWRQWKEATAITTPAQEHVSCLTSLRQVRWPLARHQLAKLPTCLHLTAITLLYHQNKNHICTLVQTQLGKPRGRCFSVSEVIPPSGAASFRVPGGVNNHYLMGKTPPLENSDLFLQLPAGQFYQNTIVQYQYTSQA